MSCGGAAEIRWTLQCNYRVVSSGEGPFPCCCRGAFRRRAAGVETGLVLQASHTPAPGSVLRQRCGWRRSWGLQPPTSQALAKQAISHNLQCSVCREPRHAEPQRTRPKILDTADSAARPPAALAQRDHPETCSQALTLDHDHDRHWQSGLCTTSNTTLVVCW